MAPEKILTPAQEEELDEIERGVINILLPKIKNLKGVFSADALYPEAHKMVVTVTTISGETCSFLPQNIFEVSDGKIIFKNHTGQYTIHNGHWMKMSAAEIASDISNRVMSII